MLVVMMVSPSAGLRRIMLYSGAPFVKGLNGVSLYKWGAPKHRNRPVTKPAFPSIVFLAEGRGLDKQCTGDTCGS